MRKIEPGIFAIKKAFFHGGNDAWMKIWMVSINTSTLKELQVRMRRDLNNSK